MKKIVYFIPAILSTLFYLSIMLMTMTMELIMPVAFGFVAFLWVAGILLSKDMFLGGIIGAIPSSVLIYIGTQDNGQIFSETPLGVAFLLFYCLCTGYVIYKKAKLKNNNS